VIMAVLAVLALAAAAADWERTEQEYWRPDVREHEQKPQPGRTYR